MAAKFRKQADNSTLQVCLITECVLCSLLANGHSCEVLNKINSVTLYHEWESYMWEKFQEWYTVLCNLVEKFHDSNCVV